MAQTKEDLMNELASVKQAIEAERTEVKAAIEDAKQKILEAQDLSEAVQAARALVADVNSIYEPTAEEPQPTPETPVAEEPAPTSEPAPEPPVEPDAGVIV